MNQLTQILLGVMLLSSCIEDKQPEPIQDTLLITDTVIYWNGYTLTNESP